MVMLVFQKLTTPFSTSQAMDIPSSDRDGRTQKAARAVLQDFSQQVDLEESGFMSRLSPLSFSPLAPPEKIARSVLQDFSRQGYLQKGDSLAPPAQDAPEIDSDSDDWDCDASKQPEQSSSKSVEDIMFEEGRVFEFDEDR